ncbi:hypothetical protein ACWG0P_14100 [Amedibacillus sp. YH-ame6]
MEDIRGITKDFDDEKRKILVKGTMLPFTTNTPEYQFSDLDNEGIRLFATGVLRRNRIRSNIMSINLSWESIAPSMAESILDLVMDETFTVDVYDRTQKKRVNKTMYRSADVSYKEEKIMGGYVASLSFSLIEC